MLSNEAFNYLRGDLQLGYFCTAFEYEMNNVAGIVVLVQGSKSPPHKVDLAIEDVLQRVDEQI